MKYYKKVLNTGAIELHIQSGFMWGNDLTCVEDATWGTYSPLSDEEHRARGYVEITRDEAEELAALAGEKLPGEKDVFASSLGFRDRDALMDASREVYREGDISWYITEIPDGRWAAWDDAEIGIDRVEYFDYLFQAENFLAVSYSEKITDPAQRFLFILGELEKILDRPHREGHCEHAGYCEVIPVLRRFLESPEGEKSLEEFAEWYSGEGPTELFHQLGPNEFVSSSWIHEDELTAWYQAVKNAGIEHAIVKEQALFNNCTTGGHIVSAARRTDTVIARYSIVIDVAVTETGKIIEKVTYPDFLLPSTVVSVLRDAAAQEEES
jgi:hypothetical protein